jgi:hypothetical protein
MQTPIPASNLDSSTIVSADDFCDLLERASEFFKIFDSRDFWIPAKRSTLHSVLEEYVQLDAAGRSYASEKFDWSEDEFNEFWTFYPCGYLLEYCDALEGKLSELTDSEYMAKIKECAEKSPFDPWDEL